MDPLTTHSTDPPWLDRTLYPFRSQRIDITGHSVHYVDEGTGPTLLFVHGNPDWSFLYRDVIAGLHDEFRCVALDLPGFGLSREAAGYGYTPAEHAEVLARFIERLDLTDVTLVLHDWGGPIGLSAAQADPSRIRALVIGGSHAFADFHSTRPLGEKIMMRVMASKLGRRWVERHNVLVQGVLDREMAKQRGPVPAEVRSAYLGPLDTPQRRRATWIFLNHNYRPLGVPFLARVEAGLRTLADKPVLFTWGGADIYTTQARELARFKAIFTDHDTTVFPGHGHFYPETAGSEMAAAIRRWWRRRYAAGDND